MPQHLEKLGQGHQPWKAFRVIVEENHAEVNFELVERLAEREEPPALGARVPATSWY